MIKELIEETEAKSKFMSWYAMLAKWYGDFWYHDEIGTHGEKQCARTVKRYNGRPLLPGGIWPFIRRVSPKEEQPTVFYYLTIKTYTQQISKGNWKKSSLPKKFFAQWLFLINQKEVMDSSSVFANIVRAPEDPILGVRIQFFSLCKSFRFSGHLFTVFVWSRSCCFFFHFDFYSRSQFFGCGFICMGGLNGE